jgi:hypothetical protein
MFVILAEDLEHFGDIEVDIVDGNFNNLAFNKNLAYLQSELTKEWYTPNITTQDIQAENPNPMFRCVKCDKEWVVINEKSIRC